MDQPLIDDREKLYRYLAGQTGGLAVPDPIEATIEGSKDLLSAFPQAGRAEHWPKRVSCWWLARPACWYTESRHSARGFSV